MQQQPLPVCGEVRAEQEQNLTMRAAQPVPVFFKHLFSLREAGAFPTLAARAAEGRRRCDGFETAKLLQHHNSSTSANYAKRLHLAAGF